MGPWSDPDRGVAAVFGVAERPVLLWLSIGSNAPNSGYGGVARCVWRSSRDDPPGAVHGAMRFGIVFR